MKTLIVPGNEYIYQLTSAGDYELRVDLKDWNDDERWAAYQHFFLSNEQTNYTLNIGDYRGTAGQITSQEISTQTWTTRMTKIIYAKNS